MNELYNIDTRAEDLILTMVHAGIFEIDDKGRIWRVGVRRGNGPVKAVKRRRAEYQASNGYLRLRVSINGIRIRVSAHRVVYRHFYGDIPSDYVVDHAGARDDNRPHMLSAVTQSENVRRIYGRRVA